MDLTFDVGSILTGEEAQKLFEEQEQNAQNEQQQQTDNHAEEEDNGEENQNQLSEEVGDGSQETGEDDAASQDDGSSPIFPSIAEAFRNDGVFPDFTDEEIQAATTPDAFAELVQKAITAGIDARVKRADEALQMGVATDVVNNYETTLSYLEGITEDAISQEGDNGENLRRQMIWNDLINRGYTEDKARKELEKSFKAGSDVEDAKDALEALKKFYTQGYEKVKQDSKKRQEEALNAQKKQSEDFRKMVVESEVKIGDTVLDSRTCQRIYDAVSKPVYKDPTTGQLLTAVQKFQKEQPLEFLKQLGMWFVLTDGGKNTEGFTKEQLRAEKNKSIKELGRKINASSLNRDGSLKYVSGGSSDSDPLLSDGWKIGW